MPFFFLFILAVTIEITLGVCTVDNVQNSQGEIMSGHYLSCKFENISSDLYRKVQPYFFHLGYNGIEWLEISDTDNRILSLEGYLKFPVNDLRIYNANIHEIYHNAFSDLESYLSRLSLKNNKLSSIEDYYFKGLHLTYLDLSFNNISNINENSFIDCGTLETLILKNNFLSELPPNLFKRSLTSLTHLDISFNQILSLDNQIFFSLNSLFELRINNNYLNDLDKNILSENRNLAYLYINNNQFRGFHNLNLPTLSITFINASHNTINFFNFSSNINIRTLDLSSNGITSTKNVSLANATVNRLLLDNNNLESTHDTFFISFPLLSDFSLTNNKLKQLNRNFKNTTKLVKVNLAKNYLRSSDLLNLPKSLNYLHLSFNNLTEIEFNSLHDLKMLKVLCLDHNQIRKIDLGSFKDLNQLIKLDLSNNEIYVLEIGVFVGLNALQHIDLSFNRLHQVSGNVFYNLRSLKVINLSKTKVTYNELEAILLHLPNVEKIGLAENGWSCSRIVDIMHKFGKKVIDVGDYTTTNVDGVACNLQVQDSSNLSHLETANTNIVDGVAYKHEDIQKTKNLSRLLEIVNLSDSKLHTIEVLLIFLNVFIGILFLNILYLSFIWIAFIRKSNNNKNARINSDQELQLISCS
ncbi:protein artichoke-like [Tribolium madens]|uniref:protein artichoke-like n=1 Tax=Tribolium madens TaxID=41895 RepID=UPI001CF729D3|nr:protein artichoke-like [Tribolium madens]